MTPLERGVREFLIEFHRRRFQQEEDTVLEAPTYWGVVELVRERVAEASDATPEEIRAALHAVGYSVQAVSNSLYRLL